MPLLKELLSQIPNTNERRTQIRVETIECIGFILGSVRHEEGFQEAIDQLMEYFINLEQILDKNDIEHTAIIEVYCQISSYITHGFAKYMPLVFEIITQKLENENELILEKQNVPQNSSHKVYKLI